MQLNGNLTLNADGSGVIENAFIEKGSADPVTNLSEGRLFYNTTSNSFKFRSDSAWVELSQGTAFGGALGDLSNVTAASPWSVGDVMYASTTTAMALAGPGSTSGVQAHDAGLDSISGLTTAADKMIYTTASDTYAVSDLTSFGRNLLDDTSFLIMTQTLSLEIGVDTQAFDAVLDDLSALAVVADDQIIIGTGAGTFGYLTMSTYMQGLMDDADQGTFHASINLEIGTDVQAFDAELSGLAGLSGTGIVVKTGAGTFTERSIVESTTNAINITNGDGVSGNPSIAIDAGLDSIAGLTTAADKMIYTTASDVYAVTDLTSTARSLLDDGSFGDMRTSLGLVSGGAGDIWVEKGGDVMTGFLTLSADPTATGHAATKSYVDSVAAGLDPKESVKGSTSAAGIGTYAAAGGTNASGAFTAVDLTSDATFDDVPTASAFIVGDRILVKDQADAKQNGIYAVTTAGASGAMERATDHDGTPANEVSGGNHTYVELGTSFATTGWVMSGEGNITLNTDDVNWVQFSAAGTFTAGLGLGQSGTNIFVNFGAGVVETPSDEVGLDIETSGLILSTDGAPTVSAPTDAASRLRLDLDGSTLAKSASGVKVDAAGITATELNTSVAGNGIVGGGGTPLALSFNETSTATIAQGDELAFGDIDGSDVVKKITASDFMDQLDIVHGLAGNGFAVQTAADTYVNRSIAASAVAGDEGISIVNGDGVSGNPTVGLDVIGLAALATAPDMTDVLFVHDVTATASNKSMTVQNLADAIGGVTSLGELENVDSSADTETAGKVLVAEGDTWIGRSIQYQYSGAASLTHVVTHNLNNQYCNVTVIDASDQVIIPQSVTFDTVNQLTIVVNSSIALKAVVMGVDSSAI